MISSGPEDEEPRARFLDSFRVILVVVGYATLAVCILAIALLSLIPQSGIVVGLASLSFIVVFPLMVLLARRDQLRDLIGARLRLLADVLVLCVLMAWGLFYNSAARFGESPEGKPPFAYLALAQPEVLGVVGLHALTVLAYAISRRRPGALHPASEPLVHGCLIVGLVLHALVAVQLRGLLLLGLVPPLLPFATPVLTIFVYTEELVSRLRRRGGEAAASPPLRPHDTAFRAGPPQLPLPPAPRIHRRLLAQALVTSLVVFAAWALAQKAILGYAPLQVFTRTYGHTLSKLPSPVDVDAHSGTGGVD